MPERLTTPSIVVQGLLVAAVAVVASGLIEAPAWSAPALATVGVGLSGVAIWARIAGSGRRRDLRSIEGSLLEETRDDLERVLPHPREEIGRRWNKLLRDREDDLIDEIAGVVRADLKPARGAFDMGLASALPVGVMVCRPDGTIEISTPICTPLLEPLEDESGGHGGIAERARHAELAELVLRVGGGGPLAATVTIGLGDETRDGVMEARAARVTVDGSVRVLVTLLDVTAQRIASEAQSAFIDQVAHEMRTPLTNILLYVEEAIEQGANDPKLQRDALGVIGQESRRLRRLIGDMLQASELESGTMTLRNSEVKLRQMFEEIESDFGQQALQRGQTLSFDLPPRMPRVVGDRDKLHLAIQNLVGNALKYTPDGGTVTVSLGVEGPDLTVTVRDTGFGIAPDQQEAIFERFARANDERLEGIVGTGLGLPITREIARLHGGDVTVESALDQGSAFELRVPIVEDSTMAAA